MMRKRTKIFILAIIIAHALLFLLIYVGEHTDSHDDGGMSIDMTQFWDLLFPQLPFWVNFYALLWLFLLAFGYFLYWHSSESKRSDIHYFKANAIMKQKGLEDPELELKPSNNTDSFIYWGKLVVLMVIVLMIIFVLIVMLLSYPAR